MNDTTATTARVENDHMMLARLQGCGVYPCGILGPHEHTIYGPPPAARAVVSAGDPGGQQ